MEPDKPQDYSYLYDQQTPIGGSKSGGGKAKRIIIGGSALLMFILIVIMVSITLFKGPDYRLQLGSIAAEQQELVRVSELGLKSRTAGIETKILAANISSVAGGSLYALTDFVENNYELPLDSALLNSGQTDIADTRLEQAETRNAVDEEFAEIMLTLLENTNQSIEDLGTTVEDDDIILLLRDIFNNNQLLIESIN